MTETEWMNGDVEAMLRFLRGKISDRKLRLYNLACCELVLPLLEARPYCQYPLFQAAASLFELLERCAEEATNDEELDSRLNDWMTHWDNADWYALEQIRRGRLLDEDKGLFSRWPTAQAYALQALWLAANASYGRVDFLHESVFSLSYHVWAALNAPGDLSCALFLNDLTGSPFRRVEIDPICLSYLDGSAKRIAESIYAEKNFGDLPILADALEEAGCQSSEVAFHLRAYHVHVRGCWVLDRILGKD